jgi:hypothetical protein
MNKLNKILIISALISSGFSMESSCCIINIESVEFVVSIDLTDGSLHIPPYTKKTAEEYNKISYEEAKNLCLSNNLDEENAGCIAMKNIAENTENPEAFHAAVFLCNMGRLEYEKIGRITLNKIYENKNHPQVDLAGIYLSELNFPEHREAGRIMRKGEIKNFSCPVVYYVAVIMMFYGDLDTKALAMNVFRNIPNDIYNYNKTEKIVATEVLSYLMKSSEEEDRQTALFIMDEFPENIDFFTAKFLFEDGNNEKNKPYYDVVHRAFKLISSNAEHVDHAICLEFINTIQFEF